jgi:hypothetical protein
MPLNVPTALAIAGFWLGLRLLDGLKSSAIVTPLLRRLHLETKQAGVC